MVRNVEIKIWIQLWMYQITRKLYSLLRENPQRRICKGFQQHQSYGQGNSIN